MSYFGLLTNGVHGVDFNPACVEPALAADLACMLAVLHCIRLARCVRTFGWSLLAAGRHFSRASYFAVHYMILPASLLWVLCDFSGPTVVGGPFMQQLEHTPACGDSNRVALAYRLVLACCCASSVGYDVAALWTWASAVMREPKPREGPRPVSSDNARSADGCMLTEEEEMEELLYREPSAAPEPSGSPAPLTRARTAPSPILPPSRRRHTAGPAAHPHRQEEISV
eukprot:TRINITY_DN12736_c0_g1_i1.p1 TRINITY_DN12736_c0_g1~~TRINITY_DN12736_c0_g1_i1.p1  ORF type:complete len:227 (+),score=69.16 TRINITY_DN12736_c0_g1_i1:68-748(+)